MAPGGPAEAPGGLPQACWGCGNTADALRRRIKGRRELRQLPGVLVLEQSEAARMKGGMVPGCQASHALVGLCNRCDLSNARLAEQRAQQQRSNTGRQLARTLGEALSMTSLKGLWDI